MSAKALSLAKGSAGFVRSHLYDEASRQLWRSYRDGQGPAGQADDYAFFIQGLLDLYEASAEEEYFTGAIGLQEKLDELFYDTDGGGYFVSALDEHILIRMKDAQVSPDLLVIAVTEWSHLVRVGRRGAQCHVRDPLKPAAPGALCGRQAR